MPTLATTNQPDTPLIVQPDARNIAAEEMTTLLRTLEAMEQLDIPPLPEEVAFRRLDSLPDTVALPALRMPAPARANAASSWQRRLARRDSGTSRRQLLAWRIWQRLLYIATPEDTTPDVLKPWLELRDLLRNPLLVLSDQTEQLEQWSQQYRGHVANYLAGSLRALMEKPKARRHNRRIAVLLPLSGALQPAGLLISTGIRIAWFQLRQQQLQLPELLFFDSNQPALSLTNQIMSSQVHLVIGPLKKDRIGEFAASLSEHPLHPPTLLLNETDSPLPNQSFWEFGLPMEREIQALAHFARSRGIHRAGALMVASQAGLRAGNALELAWESLGGEWVGTEVITTQGEVTEAGRDLLLLEASARRNALLQRITSRKTKHIPRQRTDLDALFIAAPGGGGHQITAALAYNYLAGIPIYSLSGIYQPHESGNKFDLENIIFMDMPWMIAGPQILGYGAAVATPEYRKRLIAFGIDALTIALRLERTPPDKRLPHWGTTGVLTAENQRISWAPAPATIRQGVPRPLRP